MISAELDHIVIAAANLRQGEEYISEKLGVQPVPGGSHPKQGTHNSLLKLEENSYLEIIAINPKAPEPDHPRWFNLDDPNLQKAISREPKVISWVARTSDIKKTISKATYNSGNPMSASRGDLSWTFTFQENGSLIEGGVLPPLIEWDTNEHPSSKLPESDIVLNQIKAFHSSPDLILDHLKSIGLEESLKIEKSNSNKIGLEATFHCPTGEETLYGLHNQNN